MRIINAQEVRQLLPMHECIELVEELYRGKRNAGFKTPQRIVEQIPEKEAVWLFMPSYSLKLQKLVIKIVNEYKLNPSLYNLPKAFGLLLLFDFEKGVPLAIIDSVELTAIRTGALSGAATKYLANNSVEYVTLIGSGIQAWTQLEAVTAVRNISKVYVYSSTKANRESFAKRAAEKFGLEATAVNYPHEAARKSELIIAATNSPNPVLFGDWLKEGVHVNSIGVLPNRRELDDSVFAKADTIVADVKENVLREAGDIIHAVNNRVIDPITIVELEDLIIKGTGKREDEKAITVFKSVGFADIDLYVASYVYAKSLEKNVGSEIDFRRT